MCSEAERCRRARRALELESRPLSWPRDPWYAAQTLEASRGFALRGVTTGSPVSLGSETRMRPCFEIFKLVRGCYDLTKASRRLWEGTLSL